MDFGEPGPAILSVNHADDGGHDQTPSANGDNSLRPELFRADFVAAQNRFHV